MFYLAPAMGLCALSFSSKKGRNTSHVLLNWQALFFPSCFPIKPLDHYLTLGAANPCTHDLDHPADKPPRYRLSGMTLYTSTRLDMH
jgi:hypothetical protein